LIPYFHIWETLAKHRIVVWPREESVTKALPYLKAMLRNAIMRKMEIPGLVSGLGLIIGTIVLILYTIH
jgi:hypothetical protein